MKIIHRYGWSGSLQSCPKCLSDLLVEADDIIYHKDVGFYAFCPICNGANVIISDSRIPYNIKLRITKGNNP